MSICSGIRFIFRKCHPSQRANSYNSVSMSCEVVAVASTSVPFHLTTGLVTNCLWYHRGIAWSRQGTIASISKDGQSINLRFLRSHPENGSWQLSQPTPWHFPAILPDCPIVHLAWAGQSSPELAIIDSVGRVSIMSFSITLNRPYPARKWDQDLVDDLQAVVGCYWLPLASPSRQVLLRASFIYQITVRIY